MKNSYPVVLIPEEKGFTVYIPDFNINTQGDDLTEAIEMARDAIGLMGIDMENDGKTLPPPTAISEVKTASAAEIVTLVDVDFCEYRRKNEITTVKKNCALPSRQALKFSSFGGSYHFTLYKQKSNIYNTFFTS